MVGLVIAYHSPLFIMAVPLAVPIMVQTKKLKQKKRTLAEMKSPEMALA